MPADLYNEHAALLELADEFLAAVRTKPRLPVDQLNRLRVRMGALVRKHGQTEEEHVFRPLINSGILDNDTKLSAAINHVQREKTLYSEHVRKWTPQAIDHDWDGYVAAVEDRIAVMKAVIREEEDHIYRFALGSGVPKIAETIATDGKRGIWA